MRHYFTILSQEIRALLYSSSTYIAAVLFLLVMGFIFTGVLDLYSKTPQESPPAAVFFQLFWIPVFFMVPLLTMKSFAEERRQGTLETLLTAPVSTAEVVLGKFSAAYLFYLLLCCNSTPATAVTSMSVRCSAATYLSPSAVCSSSASASSLAPSPAVKPWPGF
jgi:ABC-type transport system involved in multi-copper enzyme maturation permease subunit